MLVRQKEPKSFWGFMAVGFIALAGGIVMFIIAVPKWNAPEGQAPADLSMIFTKVYSVQANLRSSNQPFSPELSFLGVDKEICAQFSCVIHLIDSGKDYEMLMTKNGRTWRITSKNMVPEEIRMATQ